MITTLEKKFFPVASGEYTRITAELLSIQKKLSGAQIIAWSL